MEFKGTKGNWRVRNGNGLLFVESPKEDLGTPYGQEIMADDYFNEDEKIYDAYLVANAPELLKALEESQKLLKEATTLIKGPVYGLLSRISDNKKVINKALAKNI